MRFSIVIPQYRETEQHIFSLLASIDGQLGIDFGNLEVIIVNDGSDVLLSDSFLQSFPHIKPRYIRLEKNVGNGLCRQAGLDRASGDYVLFCDADDCLQNTHVLHLYLRQLKEHPDADIIFTSWLEELSGGEYVKHEQDTTWLHTKLFRRQFLTDNNIRFSPHLPCHIDTFFVGVCFDLTEKRFFADELTYVWKWNEQSLTRQRNGEFFYTKFRYFIRAFEEKLEVLKKRKPEVLPYTLTQFMLYVYFIYQLPWWDEPEAVSYYKETRRQLGVFLKPNVSYLDSYPHEKFYDLFCRERKSVFLEASLVEKETYQSFINKLMNYESTIK